MIVVIKAGAKTAIVNTSSEDMLFNSEQNAEWMDHPCVKMVVRGAEKLGEFALNDQTGNGETLAYQIEEDEVWMHTPADEAAYA